MNGKRGWIRVVSPSLDPPSLRDNTADVDRLVRGVKKNLQVPEIRVDFSLLMRLPALLRSEGYRVSAVVVKEGAGWRLVDAFPAGREAFYGAAVDLGTSTVVLRLVNLENGGVSAEKTFFNPQIRFGEDILTRIHFAAGDSRLDSLRTVLLERLNAEIRELGQSHGIAVSRIVGAVLAGNTTMTHLFLGLNPFWICREPYIPAVNKIDVLRASRVGLGIHPEAPVFVFPNVGSYFGGDLIAGILASGMDRLQDVSILVDVGTNAEVVLGNSDWLMACAGAAGPALEGGVARMGMMAGPGVIDHVECPPGAALVIHTIGDEPPVGICGSGLIDLVSCLFREGMLDMRGKFVPSACGGRLVEDDGIQAFTVVAGEASGTGEPLRLSQPDVDALMRSKAAMYTILTTITSMVGLSLSDLHTFFVAGTFGSYIDPGSAITLGMIPDLPLDRYKSLGNTSLEGATLALLDGGAFPRIEDIRDRITYVELNVNQEFMNLFSAAKFIPHTDRSLFPSVKGGQ